MSTDDLKTTVIQWAKTIGREKAVGRLLLTGKVSVSTADQLVDGRYISSPREKIRSALVSELLKDGFTLTDGKAS